MSYGPAVYVNPDIANIAQSLINQSTGVGCREGVELVLKNDLSINHNQSYPFPPPNSFNAGFLVQRGLKVLADSPTEALGVSRSDDISVIRKAYKKMALKYHPDKSPTTAPLFQIICSAYEKLCLGAPQKSTYAPPKSPTKTTPPPVPKPSAFHSTKTSSQSSSTSSTYNSSSSTSSGTGTSTGSGSGARSRYKRDPSQYASAGDNNPHADWESFHKPPPPPSAGTSAGTSGGSGFSTRGNAYYPSSAGMGAGSSSATFKQYQQEAVEREKRRQREFEEAAARTAQRRAQYSKPSPPTAASGSTSSSSGSGRGVGGASNMPPPPPPPASGSAHAYRRASAPTNDPYGAGGTGFYGSNTSNPTGTSGSNPYERHAYSSGFPTPTGLSVQAIDSTTAEVQWDPPPSASGTGSFSGVSYKVELSWAASTAPYGQWEVASKLVGGDRVRKKNLEAGAMYKFRIRFAREEGGRKGPFCKSESVQLPKEEVPSHTSSPRATPPPPHTFSTDTHKTQTSSMKHDAGTSSGVGAGTSRPNTSHGTSDSTGGDRRSGGSQDSVLPHPSGLRAVAMDSTTVELQWDLPNDTSTILGVELSWNLMFGEQASLEWEVAGKQIYGDVVRKKNLVPGGHYKFRIRYVRESGIRGSWCRSVLVKLPDAPASGPSTTSSKPTTKPFSTHAASRTDQGFHNDSSSDEFSESDEEDRTKPDYSNYYGSDNGGDGWRNRGKSTKKTHTTTSTIGKDNDVFDDDDYTPPAYLNPSEDSTAAPTVPITPVGASGEVGSIPPIPPPYGHASTEPTQSPSTFYQSSSFVNEKSTTKSKPYQDQTTTSTSSKSQDGSGDDSSDDSSNGNGVFPPPPPPATFFDTPSEHQPVYNTANTADADTVDGAGDVCDAADDGVGEGDVERSSESDHNHIINSGVRGLHIDREDDTHSTSGNPTICPRDGSSGNGSGVLDDIPEEEDFTGAEKLFKLHPPSHYGTHFTVPDTSPAGTAASVAAASAGEDPTAFTLPVRASTSERSVVIGYVTVNRIIFVRLRHGDWLYCQTHWSAVTKGSKRHISSGVKSEPMWGWVKRCVTIDTAGDASTTANTSARDNQEENGHVYLRQVPIPTTNKLANSKQQGTQYRNRVKSPLESGTSSHDGSSRSDESTADDDDENDYEDTDFLFNHTWGSSGTHTSEYDDSEVPVWYEQKDTETGHTYYYNELTGESDWYAPEWIEEIDEASDTRYYLRLNREGGSTLTSTWTRPKQFARLVRLQM